MRRGDILARPHQENNLPTKKNASRLTESSGLDPFKIWCSWCAPHRLGGLRPKNDGSYESEMECGASGDVRVSF